MEYKIEKKVQPPPSKGSRHNYPFDKMEVGDSFLVRIEDRKNKNIYSLQGSVLQAANGWVRKNNNGYEFTCRSEGSIGVRIWRIK